MADERGEPGFVAEADTPWGRLRVCIWPTRPLGHPERKQLLQHLATVTAELARRKIPGRVVLEHVREACAGEHAEAVSAELVALRQRGSTE